MEPAQAADTTRVIVTSFGVGIGLVAVPLLINLFSDGFDRLKRKRRDRSLPSLEEYAQMQRTPPPTPTPTATLGGGARIPMLPRR